MMKITILGCGPSSGVPMIGCECKVCKEKKPKNIRTKSSAIFTTDDKTNIIIDTGTDFRSQILKAEIYNISGVLYTHAHSDHCLGIDDLRVCAFSKKEHINIYGVQEIIDDLWYRFKFLFKSPRPNIAPWLKLNANIIEYNKEFTINNTKILPFKQQHGSINSTGFIIIHEKKNVIYSTDVSDIEQETLDFIKNTIKPDIWILSYIGYDQNHAHASPEKIHKWIDYVKPKKTILTHMSHAVDYYEDSKKMPENVIIGFDGMNIIA